MKTYFSICSSKLFWLKETLMHPGLNRAWRACFPVEGYSRRQLEHLRDSKLERVLRHAATTVPYYRDYFAQISVDPAKVALSDFPVVGKSDIRGNEERFVSSARGMPKISWSRTSGSTGEPFRFGRSEFDYAYATLWRGLLRFGIRPGDKRVLVKGVDEAVHVSLGTRLRRWVYGIVNRCIVIDAHFLAKSEENVLRELRRMLSYRPKYIHGYANSIYLLARTAESKGIDLSAMKVKAVVTESEKCHDFQRELLERVFAAPVVENYGCVEFGMIAQPAKDGAMCINEDHVVAESLADGSAVFTNLDEFAFPLIRYRNGDEMKIGASHPTLPYLTVGELSGRKTESIKLPNGGALHGFVPMYPVSKHSKWMNAYQIYQPDIRTMIIRIVLSQGELPDEVRSQIQSEMRAIVGDGMEIRFEFPKDIPLTRRGKRLFIVSDVS